MRHDKRFEKLDALDDYQLVDDSQDIRGMPLVSPAGEKYGTIEDLLVGPDRDRVVAVRLDNGRVCAVEPLEIHENAVVYGDKARAYAEKGVAEGAVIEEEVLPIGNERVVIGKYVTSGPQYLNR